MNWVSTACCQRSGSGHNADFSPNTLNIDTKGDILGLKSERRTRHPSICRQTAHNMRNTGKAASVQSVLCWNHSLTNEKHPNRQHAWMGFNEPYLSEVQGDVHLVVLRAAGQGGALPPSLRPVHGVGDGVSAVAVALAANVAVLSLRRQTDGRKCQAFVQRASLSPRASLSSCFKHICTVLTV